MTRSRKAGSFVLLVVSTLAVACQLVAGLGGERVEDAASSPDATGDGHNGEPLDAGACSAAPDAGIAQVAAGESSACVVTGAGQVYCWGEGTGGQLAVDPTKLADCGGGRVCSAKPSRVAISEGVRSVAVGVDVACAVDRKSGVWCWGVDDENQLGKSAVGDTFCGALGRPCRFTPAPLTDVVAGPGDAASLSVSGRTGCAVLADATPVVNCWGSNTEHMLGNNASTSFVDHDPVPYAVGWFDQAGVAYPTDTVSLSLCSPGDGRACHGCLLSQQALACWGGNASGELGHEPASDPDCDAQCNGKTLLVLDVYDVQSIASGEGASCAVRTNGQVTCWGAQANGQRGVLDAGTAAWQATDVNLIAATIDGRARTFCAVTPSGQVFCWGRTTDGEVGLLDAGTCEAGRCARLPRAVAFPREVQVQQVSVGDGFALALGSNGVVYAWGSNAYGRLGHAPGTAGDVPCASGFCNPVPTPVCW